MAKNENEQKQTQPAMRKGMSDFLKALLWTGIPIVVMSLISICIAINWTTMPEWAGFVFGGGGVVILCVLAVLACVGFAIARKQQIAFGILAGIGIGLVGLVLTYFVEVSIG
jgi:uncharacterized protein involved in cysteine biosynthesis